MFVHMLSNTKQVITHAAPDSVIVHQYFYVVLTKVPFICSCLVALVCGWQGVYYSPTDRFFVGAIC